MEYRIQPNDAATKATRQLEAGSKARKNNRLETKGTTSLRGSWSNAASGLSVQSNFQDFLAQETALQSSRKTAIQAEAGSSKTAATQQTTDRTHEIVHILQKGETIWELAREKYKVDPAEILRCNKIDNPNKLRVGQQIHIPTESQGGLTGTSEKVVAGWYGEYHQGRLMANGEPFDMHGATIAHRDIPIGAEVELENPKTGEKARAVVTDRGPYHRGRDVDLSYGLAQRLSIAKQGVGNLKMRVL
jgi:rare lipoprotein A